MAEPGVQVGVPDLLALYLGPPNTTVVRDARTGQTYQPDVWDAYIGKNARVTSTIYTAVTESPFLKFFDTQRTDTPFVSTTTTTHHAFAATARAEFTTSRMNRTTQTRVDTQLVQHGIQCRISETALQTPEGRAMFAQQLRHLSVSMQDTLALLSMQAIMTADNLWEPLLSGSGPHSSNVRSFMEDYVRSTQFTFCVHLRPGGGLPFLNSRMRMMAAGSRINALLMSDQTALYVKGASAGQYSSLGVPTPAIQDVAGSPESQMTPDGMRILTVKPKVHPGTGEMPHDALNRRIQFGGFIHIDKSACAADVMHQYTNSDAGLCFAMTDEELGTNVRGDEAALVRAFQGWTEHDVDGTHPIADVPEAGNSLAALTMNEDDRDGATWFLDGEGMALRIWAQVNPEDLTSDLVSQVCDSFVRAAETHGMPSVQSDYVACQQWLTEIHNGPQADFMDHVVGGIDQFTLDTIPNDPNIDGPPSSAAGARPQMIKDPLSNTIDPVIIKQSGVTMNMLRRLSATNDPDAPMAVRTLRLVRVLANTVRVGLKYSFNADIRMLPAFTERSVESIILSQMVGGVRRMLIQFGAQDTALPPTVAPDQLRQEFRRLIETIGMEQGARDVLMGYIDDVPLGTVENQTVANASLEIATQLFFAGLSQRGLETFVRELQATNTRGGIEAGLIAIQRELNDAATFDRLLGQIPARGPDVRDGVPLYVNATINKQNVGRSATGQRIVYATASDVGYAVGPTPQGVQVGVFGAAFDGRTAAPLMRVAAAGRGFAERARVVVAAALGRTNARDGPSVMERLAQYTSDAPTLQQMAALFFLTSEMSRESWLAMLKGHLMLPLNWGIFRPFKTYNALSVVGARTNVNGDSSAVRLFVHNFNFMLGPAAGPKSLDGHLSGFLGADVVDPRGLYVVHGVQCLGPVGLGGSTRLIDPNFDVHADEPTGAVIVVPLIGNRYNMGSIVPLDGRGARAAARQIQTGHNGPMPAYNAAGYVVERYGLNRIIAMDAGNTGLLDYNGGATNLLMRTERWALFNPRTGKYDLVTEGKTQWGNIDGPGAYNVRHGYPDTNIVHDAPEMRPSARVKFGDA